MIDNPVVEQQRPGDLREPYREALEHELNRVERITVSFWRWMSAAGVLAGVVYALLISRALGWGGAATSALFLAWFSVLTALWKRGRPSSGWLAANGFVEALMPWAFAVVVTFTQGAAYALASWVPPMLFCALLVSYTARFRPLMPLVVGLCAALGYLLLYWLVIRGRLEPGERALLINQPATQLARAVSLISGGVFAGLITTGIRHMIGRAEASVREQDLFGKYRILAEVGSGGMGSVFEARYCPEGGFERRVAIKRIHPHLSSEPRFVEGFRREAELCARLAHPNVVQVLDFGRVAGAYFLAMEYVEGMTLSELMQKCFAVERRLPPAVAGYIAREILAGLIHAHAGARAADGKPLRVVHRDLCPQNVLLSINGEVKISDFGVARALKDAVVTHTRTVAGHAAYVAPEQARGEAVDVRSDLFPVGVMLWEMMAGRRLFLRENEPATLIALVSEPVPQLTALNSEVDRRWDAFLSRALERQPESRFSSAEEMQSQLDAIPESRGVLSATTLAELIAELGPVELPEQVEAGTEPITR